MFCSEEASQQPASLIFHIEPKEKIQHFQWTSEALWEVSHMDVKQEQAA
uniref:Uncharacterized protein n=1 Tax=Arundo donax TaxID=35708 RepID=A0A0A9H0P6_ARUDO